MVVMVMVFCVKAATPSTLMLMQRLGTLEESLTTNRPAFCSPVRITRASGHRTRTTVFGHPDLGCQKRVVRVGYPIGVGGSPESGTGRKQCHGHRCKLVVSHRWEAHVACHGPRGTAEHDPPAHTRQAHAHSKRRRTFPARAFSAVARVISGTYHAAEDHGMAATAVCGCARGTRRSAGVSAA